jgi:hypothetical protein
MPRPLAVSDQSLREAAALLERLKPQVAEVLERHRTQALGLKFSDIEADGASIGDVVARLVMVEAMKAQPGATEQEEATARQEALRQAAPERAAVHPPEDLRLTRMKGRPCELGTVRGPIPYRRDYLYFPDLGVGVFPPRPTPRRAGGEVERTGRADRGRTRGGRRLPP